MIRLFQVSIPSSVLALILSEAALVYACYVAAAYWTLEFSADIFLVQAGGLWRIALVATLVVLGLYFADLYENYRVRSRILLLQQYCLVLGVAFLAQALLSYGRWDVILPKWMMLYGSAGVLVLVPAWRLFFASAVGRALGAQRLLFLGTSPATREIVRQLVERPELGLLPVGYLTDRDGAAEPIEGIPCLGGISDLRQEMEGQHADRLVVAFQAGRAELPVDQLLDFKFKGVRVEDASALYETVFGRVSTRDLRPSEMVFSEEMGPHPGTLILQETYSLILGAIGILVTWPLMLIVAVIVRVSSPGPALFRQTRVGRNGALFTLFKFRSMYRDAEAETGAVWAVKDDPRVTPAGRWLRKMRLDELPQLFNVVRGEMSVAGPRPERPEFVRMLEEKIPYYRQRLYVKPGLTGWAQINHKYGDTVEDALAKLEYDLYYIKNLGTSLDAYIVFHTVKIVLLGRGAQ